MCRIGFANFARCHSCDTTVTQVSQVSEAARRPINPSIAVVTSPERRLRLIVLSYAKHQHHRTRTLEEPLFGLLILRTRRKCSREARKKQCARWWNSPSTQLRVDCRNEGGKNASWLFGSSNLACDSGARKNNAEQHSSNKNQKPGERASESDADSTGAELQPELFTEATEASWRIDGVNRCQVPSAGRRLAHSSQQLLVVFVFFRRWRSVYNAFYFLSACAHRSLNRPPRVRWIGSHSWRRPIGFFRSFRSWLTGVDDDDGCTRLEENGKRERSGSQTMIHWHNFPKWTFPKKEWNTFSENNLRKWATEWARNDFYFAPGFSLLFCGRSSFFTFNCRSKSSHKFSCYGIYRPIAIGPAGRFAARVTYRNQLAVHYINGRRSGASWLISTSLCNLSSFISLGRAPGDDSGRWMHPTDAIKSP